MKRALWVLPLLCLCFSAYAAGKQSIRFLFVINASDAQLRQVRGDRYQLSIPVKNIHSVLAFSDRPHRQNFRLSQSDYAKLVYVGNNSFASNPPNIALVWKNQPDKTEVYILQGHKKVGDQVVYSLTWQVPSAPVEHTKQHRGHVVLFIDPVEINELGICTQTNARPAQLQGDSVQQLKSQLAQEVRAVVTSQAHEVCSFSR